MDTELLDLDFGAEPPLAPPARQLAAGRRALRRRRLASGSIALASTAALGGVLAVGLPVLGSPSDPPFTSEPEARVVNDLPVVTPDDCLGEQVCVELVPRAHREQSRPWGNMAIGFRGERLVRYSADVEVLKAIIDPTSSGADASAAVEVRFNGGHFRVALALGFGYLVDEIDPGDAPTLEKWFAEQHALPAADCGVMSPRDGGVPRIDSPEPGECWVTLDDQGELVPRGGAHIERTVRADLSAGSMPPGIRVTGVAFERDGTQWFGVVEQIGTGAFVSTTLARVGDLAPGTSLAEWVRRTAPEMSMTGIPDGAQPEPWQTLHWWDPKTFEFRAPEGVIVVRKVDNPLGLAKPKDSAGVVFDFKGERYWVLTQVNPSQTGDESRVQQRGVTISEAEAASKAVDFDHWLANDGSPGYAR